MPNTQVTPDRIRAFMIDRGPEDNFLLDDVEMDTKSIQTAMQMVIDKFATIPPLITESYTVESFPYGAELVMGTAGYLLFMKGMNLTRNRLQHQSASGTAVDDKSRSEIYINLGRQMIDECMNNLRQIKQHLNIESGYLYLGG